jgi:hypothetical protein
MLTPQAKLYPMPKALLAFIASKSILLVSIPSPQSATMSENHNLQYTNSSSPKSKPYKTPQTISSPLPHTLPTNPNQPSNPNTKTCHGATPSAISSASTASPQTISTNSILAPTVKPVASGAAAVASRTGSVAWRGHSRDIDDR